MEFKLATKRIVPPEPDSTLFPALSLVTQLYNIDRAVEAIQDAKGFAERMAAIADYERRVNLYNSFVGWKAMDENYRPS